jgi:hypothetical protein
VEDGIALNQEIYEKVLKILGVNEHFGLGRVLDYPIRSFILVIYLLIIKDI